jgi:hypothetical protein
MTYEQEKLPEFITKQVFNNLVSIFMRMGCADFTIKEDYFLLKRGNSKTCIGFNGVKKELDFIINYNAPLLR